MFHARSALFRRPSVELQSAFVHNSVPRGAPLCPATSQLKRVPPRAPPLRSAHLEQARLRPCLCCLVLNGVPSSALGSSRLNTAETAGSGTGWRHTAASEASAQNGRVSPGPSNPHRESDASDPAHAHRFPLRRALAPLAASRCSLLADALVLSLPSYTARHSSTFP